MIERQEIHCHNCNNYVQFNLDTDLNGNHVLACPKCGHEHCRVVENGKISDVRWDQRNGKFVGTPPNNMPVYSVTYNVTYTSTSTYTVYATGSSTGSAISTNFTYTSWMNLTTAC